MKAVTIFGLAGCVLLAGGCEILQTRAGDGTGEAGPTAAQRAYPEAERQDRERPSMVLEVDEPPDVPSGPARETLTEALDRAWQMLRQEREENARLRQSIAELQNGVAEKEARVKDLEGRLQEAQSELAHMEKALQQWKELVLGFRDEMREAERAELDTLKKIIKLLTGLEARAAAPMEGGGS